MLELLHHLYKIFYSSLALNISRCKLIKLLFLSSKYLSWLNIRHLQSGLQFLSHFSVGFRLNSINLIYTLLVIRRSFSIYLSYSSSLLKQISVIIWETPLLISFRLLMTSSDASGTLQLNDLGAFGQIVANIEIEAVLGQVEVTPIITSLLTGIANFQIASQTNVVTGTPVLYTTQNGNDISDFVTMNTKIVVLLHIN